jgi:hypothetical protein
MQAARLCSCGTGPLPPNEGVKDMDVPNTNWDETSCRTGDGGGLQCTIRCAMATNARPEPTASGSWQGLCHQHWIIAQQSQWSHFLWLMAALVDGILPVLAHNHCQDVAASG